MHDPLHVAFRLAAAVQRGDAKATRNAAQAVEQELGADSTRGILRMLHLFFGLPKIVQALNACIEVLPALPTQSIPARDSAQPCDLGQGELNFRALYADDADRVLAHLAKLDPCLRAWILDHAYARALLPEGLSLAQSERLAVLCLAATACWKQWESHVAIAARQGVARAVLLADCHAASAWLGAEACAHAQAELSEQPA